MTVNLTEAHDQWSSRPDDERFWTLDELATHCRQQRETATEAEAETLELHANQGLLFANEHSVNNWSFGQLCRLGGAPSDFIADLPAPMAADVLNHRLSKRESNNALSLLTRGNELAAVTTTQYTRIWNDDVCSVLVALQDAGFRVPPARPSGHSKGKTRKATKEDVLNQGTGGGGLTVKVGDTIAPAGLYAGQSDMFAFLVNDAIRIDDGTDGGLGRGFFARNSEVGDGAFELTGFNYRYVCGNHIVWDASNVSKVRIVHRGAADDRFVEEWIGYIDTVLSRAASEDEQVIVAAKRKVLVATETEAIEFLGTKHGMSKIASQAIYEAAREESDKYTGFAPGSIWGLVQGITCHSQSLGGRMQKRAAMDAIAGKILCLAV